MSGEREEKERERKRERERDLGSRLRKSRKSYAEESVRSVYKGVGERG